MSIQEIIQQRETVIVDVRTPQEFAGGKCCRIYQYSPAGVAGSRA